MTDHPKAGDVWDYPYLWARQARAGEESGRKNRPCAVSICIQRKDGNTGIVFLAITSQLPNNTTVAIEVPETERKRANLSKEKRLWVVVDEHNQDIFEKSYYLEPQSQIGSFSSRFKNEIQTEFVQAIKARKSFAVSRTEKP
ncbi:MAG: hypothetical protein GXP03_11005 [Alphaproteobacteria bacterium]|nr:hypothetical protein [Alphaproteobacteria bacterium]